MFGLLRAVFFCFLFPLCLVTFWTFSTLYICVIDIKFILNMLLLFVGIPNGKDYLGDLSIDGMLVLKWLTGFS